MKPVKALVRTKELKRFRGSGGLRGTSKKNWNGVREVYEGVRNWEGVNFVFEKERQFLTQGKVCM